MNPKVMAPQIRPTPDEPGECSQKNVGDHSSKIVEELSGARSSRVARHGREATAHRGTVRTADQAGGKNQSW